MCTGLKYSANTRRLPVLARTRSALKNLPSITTNQQCEDSRGQGACSRASGDSQSLRSGGRPPPGDGDS